MILVPNRQKTGGRTGITALYFIPQCNLGQFTACPGALFLLQLWCKFFRAKTALGPVPRTDEDADRHTHTLYGSTYSYSVKCSIVLTSGLRCTCVFFNPYHILLPLFFLANMFFASPFSSKEYTKSWNTLWSWPAHPKAHGCETSSMTGLTGLVPSSQPQVSSGKPNLYKFSLPAVKATVYLNTKGKLEFVAKHRKASPLHQLVSAISALQRCGQHSNALQGKVTCSHHCWFFCTWKCLSCIN